MVWTLPNILTVGRIVVTPLIAILPFFAGWPAKVAALVVFIAAAVSDIIDGKLARDRGLITDLGKILDPLADKLLLVATLVPIYWLTNLEGTGYAFPVWNRLPLWVALLLIGREAFMTVLRQVAKRRGVVIAAAGAGKLKTIVQDTFMGTMLGWIAWKDLVAEYGWLSGWLGRFWDTFHGTFLSASLAAAVLLTLYSLGVYLSRYRFLFTGGPPPAHG